METEIKINVINGDENASYTLGITENFGDCLVSEWGCWTGEDCHHGFTLSENGTLSYCHPIDTSSATLTYGALPEEVIEGSTTVFGDSSFEELITYVLDQSSSIEDETCWIWGADTSYYTDFYNSCLEM